MVSGVLKGIVGAILGALGSAVEKFIELAFMVNLVETEGVFPLGKPVSSLTGEPGLMTILTDGPFVFYAAQVYDMVWLPAGGSLTVLAVFVLLIGNAANGYIDMFQFSPSKQSQQDTSLLKGLIMIIAWYPLYMGLIGLVHGMIVAFAPGASLGSLFIKQGLGAMLTGSSLLVSMGPPGWIIAAIGLLPFLLLSCLMGIRAIVMVVMLAVGPFLIAVKHADLPLVSGAADKAISKTVPIVMMPIPMGPIMFVTGEFILGSIGGAGAVLMSSTAGIFLIMVLGWGLLLAVWYTFKIVSPTLAGAVGTIGKAGMAAGLAATGNVGAATSTMRGGPGAAAARMVGKKAAGGGGSPWGGDDGSR